MQKIKELLFSHCLTSLDKQIETDRQMIQRAKDAANEETKSSAGDKYETGRAMMHLEQEKYTLHLQELMTLREKILQIPYREKHSSVVPGSLVETSWDTFFICINADEIEIEEEEYIPISLHSPLGQALQGRSAGETTLFRDQNIAIHSIC